MITDQQALLNNTQNIKLHHIIADRLLKRLFTLPFIPKKILNLGYIDHYINNKLTDHYSYKKKIEIYNVINIQQNYNNINNNYHNNYYLSTDLNNLPFLNNSFDLILSNLYMEYNINTLADNFKELHRVMMVDALLLFTIYNNENLGRNNLINIGDLLLKNQFCEPVIDQESLSINYLDPTCSNQVANIELIYGYAIGNNLVKDPIIIDC